MVHIHRRWVRVPYIFIFVLIYVCMATFESSPYSFFPSQFLPSLGSSRIRADKTSHYSNNYFILFLILSTPLAFIHYIRNLSCSSHIFLPPLWFQPLLLGIVLWLISGWLHLAPVLLFSPGPLVCPCEKWMATLWAHELQFWEMWGVWTAFSPVGTGGDEFTSSCWPSLGLYAWSSSQVSTVIN